MQTKGLDYSGFVAYELGNDGRLHPINSWREVKRRIRRKEKERRKRLKEAAEGE